jgi:prepilin-type N-terminal cleavage/methylation domain-containing protein
MKRNPGSREGARASLVRARRGGRGTPWGARSEKGFTLLEVMVAVAILGLTLVVLLEVVTNNVRATNHARLTTSATFLARQKMVDVEDDVLYHGFVDNDESENGNFKEAGAAFSQYRWETLVERVDLPTDLAQKTQDTANDTAKESKDPFSMMQGMMGGIMSSFVDPIRIGLQESVRRVTVRVFWDEPGRPNQTVEVVQYLTDPSKLTMLNATGAPGATGTGTGTTNQTGGTTTPKTGLPNFNFGTFGR